MRINILLLLLLLLPSLAISFEILSLIYTHHLIYQKHFFNFLFSSSLLSFKSYAIFLMVTALVNYCLNRSCILLSFHLFIHFIIYSFTHLLIQVFLHFNILITRHFIRSLLFYYHMLSV